MTGAAACAAGVPGGLPPAGGLLAGIALEAPLFTSPPALLAFLASLLVIVFAAARVRALAGFFRYCPPLIWTYFVPMICSTLGIIPSASPLYSDFMGDVLLPLTLVLLMVGTDTRSAVRLGPKALAMMLIGTAGIVAGATLSFALFRTQLPEGAWKGVAALSGSWIGGSSNMAAVGESLGLDPTLFGKLIVVDTVCAYTWLGLLVASAGYRRQIERLTGADSRIVDALATNLAEDQGARARPLSMLDLAAMIALGLVVSQTSLWAGGQVGAWVAAQEQAGGIWRAVNLSQVLSGYGWGILLITAVSVVMSLTALRRLEDAGASTVGNYGLYLLLTTFGARADLRAIQPDDGWLFALGVVWIATHAAFLVVGLLVLRAPLFLGATASMANIGGTASAPVVAAAFAPSLAPVGLLMAIIGSLLGTPVALLVVAKLCAALAA